MRRAREHQLERQTKRSRRLAKRTAIATGAALGATVVFAPGAQAANFTVDTTADTLPESGPSGCEAAGGDECTLREAVYDANLTAAADTVTFAPTVTGEILLLNSSGGDINIYAALDIQGPGAGTLAVAGDDADETTAADESRIFDIVPGDVGDPGDPVSISDLTLTRGYANDGGAIKAYETELTITDSVLTDNEADYDGGAIHVYSGEGDEAGTLTVVDSQLTDNVADEDGEGGGDGGAIWLEGNAFAPPPPAPPRSVADQTVLAVSGTTISGNYAGDDGGGIYSDDSEGNVVIEDATTISDNESDSRGGGIYIDDLSGAVTLTQTTVSDNVSNSYGGGIFLYDIFGLDDNLPLVDTPEDDGDVTLDRVTISGNSGGDDGGGAVMRDVDDVIVQSSIVSGNDADGDGGGLALKYVNYDATIDETTISGNYADGNGGGIYALGIGEDTDDGRLLIGESTISGNAADDGGGIYLGVNYSNGYHNADRARIQSSTVSGNQALYSGGGVTVRNVGDSANENLAILNSTIVDNGAVEAGGGILRKYDNPFLSSTIVANNNGPGADLREGPFSTGSFELAFSLIEDPGNATVTETEPGTNIFGLDPQLGQLANNDGPTQTHLPALSSPAIDAGIANGFATDQRGSPRTVGQSSVADRAGSDGTDIGSVELAQQGSPPPPPPAGVCQDAAAKRIDGTAGDDSLTGTDGVDLIFGLAGDDVLKGLIDPDCLEGGPGKDNLKGGGGNDLVKGGADNDKLRGQGGKDNLKGGAGNDKITGGEGGDRLGGGAGSDKLSGGPAKDKIKGAAGADRINAVDENKDRVNCGGGDDTAAVDNQDKVANNCEDVSTVA